MANEEEAKPITWLKRKYKIRKPVKWIKSTGGQSGVKKKGGGSTASTKKKKVKQPNTYVYGSRVMVMDGRGRTRMVDGDVPPKR